MEDSTTLPLTPPIYQFGIDILHLEGNRKLVQVICCPGYQPLTAPTVKPLIKYRCKNINKTIIGTEVNIAAAIKVPHGNISPTCNELMPMGRVFFISLVSMVKA